MINGKKRKTNEIGRENNSDKLAKIIARDEAFCQERNERENERVKARLIKIMLLLR
jgi:hypothetical protein